MLALTHVLIVHRTDNQQVVHVSGHPDLKKASEKADAISNKATTTLRATIWPIAEINAHGPWGATTTIQL
jgi:hypothetical protein